MKSDLWGVEREGSCTIGGEKKQSLLPIRWTAGTAALAGRPHICSPQGRAELRPTYFPFATH